MDGLGSQGVLQVIPPAMLEQQIAARATAAATANQAAEPQQDPSQLVSYIRSRFEIFRNHRNTSSGWSERLLQSLRTFNGQYDQSQLMEIRRFGGSEIYARVIAQKCRAASSLLRDIYLSQDRPWAVRPPANPTVPPEVVQSIQMLMQQESQMVAQSMGRPPKGGDQEKRRIALMDSAEDAAKKKASKQARESEGRIEDMLRDGGFYHALAECLVDLPIFPFSILKGPVVKVIPTVTWAPGGGKPTITMKPKLTWNRVSPFDFWMTPGVADVENAEVIEKLHIVRAEANDLLDLPGYNHDEIRAVLEEYGRGGLYDGWDSTDAERATLESRENPAWNRSAMLTMFEYNGNVQGRVLQDYGLAVPDDLRDYSVQCWVIGNHVIKCHLNPSPRQRHPYFLTSFEKVPGTPVGNSLTDLLADVQQAANATLRALVNNIAISSGPQVVIHDDVMSPDETGDQLFPWKRWHLRSDPIGTNAKAPIEFFQPTSNSQALMQNYNEFVSIADEVSAIPKYVGGSGSNGSGAGRTASGLAMLMGNAAKILQTVSANIDRDQIEPALANLSDLILLTDTTGLLSGEEKISVLGVNVAVQRETIRQRQIEFLQATMNPSDMKIMGLKGRSTVLRAISTTIGLDGDAVVPSEEQIERMVRQEETQAQHGTAVEAIQEGVRKGVEAGVQRIATELTSGEIAAQIGMPEGNPTHIGTDAQGFGPPGQQGQGDQQGKDAAAGQGGKQGQLSQGGMGPQTHLVGSQPGQAAHRLSPGSG